MPAGSMPTSGMPSQLSAEQKAHEPSMDDILASIRRIIADDDALPLSRRARAATLTDVATTRAELAAAPVSGAPAPAEAPAPVLGADAFFGLGQRLGRDVAAATPESFPSAPPAPAPSAVAPKPPMLRLRDFMTKEVAPKPQPAQEAPPVAAQMAETPASPAEPPALRPSLNELEKIPEPPRAAVVSLVQPTSTAYEPRLKIASQAFRAPVFSPLRAAAPAPVPASVQAVASDAVQDKPESHDTPPVVPPQAPLAVAQDHPATPRIAEVEPEPVDNPPSAAGPEKAEPALLSPASGAKIGASFESLAENLLMRDPLMLERVTREMLRPMLKAWLDDNLPIVVERLVRAEIERVARGRG